MDDGITERSITRHCAVEMTTPRLVKSWDPPILLPALHQDWHASPFLERRGIVWINATRDYACIARRESFCVTLLQQKALYCAIHCPAATREWECCRCPHGALQIFPRSEEGRNAGVCRGVPAWLNHRLTTVSCSGIRTLFRAVSGNVSTWSAPRCCEHIEGIPKLHPAVCALHGARSHAR